MPSTGFTVASSACPMACGTLTMAKVSPATASNFTSERAGRSARNFLPRSSATRSPKRRKEGQGRASGWLARRSAAARSRSRKKSRNVRIKAMAARRPISSQVGATAVSTMSAASWKVSPATSQRPYCTYASRKFRPSADGWSRAWPLRRKAQMVPTRMITSAIAWMATTAYPAIWMSHPGITSSPARGSVRPAAATRATGTVADARIGHGLLVDVDERYGSVVCAARRVLQGREDRVQVEGGGVLPRRELLEGLDLTRDESLHQVDEVGVGDAPVPVGVGVLVGPLEGVAPQVEDLRDAQLDEGLEPALQGLGPLLQQHHL